jgi:hypothetical protein
LSSSGTPIIPHLTKRIKNLHLFGGFYQTWPLGTRPFYKNKEWIDSNNVENYLSEFPQVLQNYQLFKKHHLPHRDKPIHVPVNLVYCTGKNTAISYNVEEQKQKKEDGDGLITTSSLLAIKGYPNIKYTEIKGQEHSGVNNYGPLLEMISKNN